MVLDNQEIEVRDSSVIPDLKECARKARKFSSKKKLQLQIFFLCDIVDVLLQKLKAEVIIEESDVAEVEELMDKIDELEVSKNLFTY